MTQIIPILTPTKGVNAPQAPAIQLLKTVGEDWAPCPSQANSPYLPTFSILSTQDFKVHMHDSLVKNQADLRSVLL